VIHLPPLASPVNQLWHVLLDLSAALSVPWTLVLTSITTGKSTAVEPGSPVGAGPGRQPACLATAPAGNGAVWRA
jgi:hypothetical protein